MGDSMDICSLADPAGDPMDLDPPEYLASQPTQSLIMDASGIPPRFASIYDPYPYGASSSYNPNPLATALSKHKPKPKPPLQIGINRILRSKCTPYPVKASPKRTLRVGSLLEPRPFNKPSCTPLARARTRTSIFGNLQPCITENDGFLDIKESPFPLVRTPLKRLVISRSREASSIFANKVENTQVLTPSTNQSPLLASPQCPDVWNEVPGHWPATPAIERETTALPEFDFASKEKKSADRSNVDIPLTSTSTANQAEVITDENAVMPWTSTPDDDILMTGGIIVPSTGDTEMMIVPASPPGTTIPQDQEYDLDEIMGLDSAHEAQPAPPKPSSSQSGLLRRSILRRTLRSSISKTYRATRDATQSLVRCAFNVCQKAISAGSGPDTGFGFSDALYFLLEKCSFARVSRPSAGRVPSLPPSRQAPRSPLRAQTQEYRIQKPSSRRQPHPSKKVWLTPRELEPLVSRNFSVDRVEGSDEESEVEYNPFNAADNRKPVKDETKPTVEEIENRHESEDQNKDKAKGGRNHLRNDHRPSVHWFESDSPMRRPISSVRLFYPSSSVIPPGRSPPVYEREWRELEKERAAKEKERIKELTGLEERAVRPLVNDWNTRVDEAMGSSDTAQIATTIAGHPLTRRDLYTCYRTGAWLNDEVINGYLALIVDYLSHNSGSLSLDNPSKTPKYHAFNSFFFSNLRDKGFNSVRRWTKRASIGGNALLDVDTVFMPVHNGSHWTLIVVKPKIKTIAHYDSLGSLSSTFVRIVKDWLRGELGSMYNDDEWRVLPSESPQQNNGSDCGVFLLTTAKAVALGIDPLRYGPSDITLLRRKIIAELMNGGLNGEFEPVGELGEAEL